jgi:hypothetical protein
MNHPCPFPFDLTEEQIESLSSDGFASGLLAIVKDKKAILSCEDMDRIEAKWQSDKRLRRSALLLLTEPWECLAQRVSEDRKFAVIVALIMQYAREAKLYQCLAEMMETAHVWTMVALSGREDMKEVIAEAETEWEKS